MTRVSACGASLAHLGLLLTVLALVMQCTPAGLCAAHAKPFSGHLPVLAHVRMDITGFEGILVFGSHWSPAKSRHPLFFAYIDRGAA